MFTNSVNAFNYSGSNIRSRFANRSTNSIDTIREKYTYTIKRALLTIIASIRKPLAIMNIDI